MRHAALVSTLGQDCSGVVVTPSGLVNINHNVSGILHIENDTTFCISDFYYDGAGPGEFASPSCLFVVDIHVVFAINS